jgi:hypothetical protein
MFLILGRFIRWDCRFKTEFSYYLCSRYNNDETCKSTVRYTGKVFTLNHVLFSTKLLLKNVYYLYQGSAWRKKNHIGSDRLPLNLNHFGSDREKRYDPIRSNNPIRFNPVLPISDLYSACSNPTNVVLMIALSMIIGKGAWYWDR